MPNEERRRVTAKPTGQPDLQAVLASAKSGKSKGRRNLVIAGLVLAGLCGTAYYFGLFGTSAPKIDYVTQPVTRGNLSTIVTSTGSVQPTEQVDISSELSGTVRKVHVNYNSEVKTGDILAELDTSEQEATLRNARAKLASTQAAVKKAQADLKSAQTTLERRKSLFGNNATSQQEVDAAQYAYDSAEATLEMNRASVMSAEADLSVAEGNIVKAKLVSPIDGVVLKRDVDPGATVAASLNAPVLFSIAGDLRKMELQVAVDEADVGKVKEGQSAIFNVDAYPERQFPATIQSVRFASETVQNVVTYLAILTVENEELLLRPGMTATANITVDSVKDALLIPNAALRFQPDQSSAQDSRRRGGVSSFMRPPRMGGPRGGNRGAGSASEERTRTKAREVYVLRGGVPTPIAIEVGISDGRMTAVTSPDIKVDDLVITDATERNK